MVLSRTSKDDLSTPLLNGLSWPSWGWFDDLFHDSEWRRPFRIEECQEDQSMLVRAELPGVDPDKDIRVEIIDDMLVITAHRSESHEHRGHHEHRSEFRYGALTRSIPVPKGVDESKITASYKDGMLEVRVPTPENAVMDEPHRIPIARG